ncbi:MAG: hypothetical protein KUA43_08235 [Hoeflea sp.]|uniref:hypothetical protein n=1 Tax=Hoeflea sp. TaxID=1940281 RepID=UPI001D998683|nr:hypothetical protein [Hoeflea sp.]MBU4528949.1 hypothetical protein [Alphaproteobacteria bacterium]MBU4544082.1 hypothetical protein [Alphaproteobacteria bacterium]MBU4551951.1 hypothetical protein [Alphaproteobacteria bacterium]MBV1723416.1 hypothetical protein [Hoeflea sp.]MBV1760395.1 hypothetical protein [Hoeflea sp.]
MIKLLVTGVWICGVALASVYFSVQTANQKEEVVPEPAMFGGLETLRGEITSIPVISDGEVQGYFLTRLSYTVEAEKVKKLTIPVPDLVTDALYTALVGEQVIDVSGDSKFDLEAFKSQVKDTLNGRLGEIVFHDVIVEQIDYLSKADIRSNMRRGGSDLLTGEPVAEAAATELPEPPAPSN